MARLIISSLLVIVFLFAVLLLKTYRSTPEKELKRQARSGDKLAEALYKVVGFGASLDIVLWVFISVSGAVLFTYVASHTAAWLSILLISFVLWFGLLWLPGVHNTQFGRGVARYTAGPLHWLIDTLYPLLARLERLVARYRPVTVHTGLYTRDDLVELLSRQRGQLDNRIPKEDLLIAKNALTFGDRLIRDCMTPRRVMKTVSAKESVGPLLMGELHKSGHSRFPVYEGGKDNFVGILYMKSMLKAKAGGLVSSVMDKQLYYVHDEESLSEVLQVFIKTRYHMFLVVNSFEEVVGLITLEDILEQIVGKPIVDEFDQHDDLRAVAAKQARKEHAKNHPQNKTGSKPTGVVK